MSNEKVGQFWEQTEIDKSMNESGRQQNEINSRKRAHHLSFLLSFPGTVTTHNDLPPAIPTAHTACSQASI